MQAWQACGGIKMCRHWLHAYCPPSCLRKPRALQRQCCAARSLQVLFRVHAAQTQAQLPAIQQPDKVVVRMVTHPQGRRLISQV